MRRTPLPNAFTLRSLVLALSLSAIHGMLPPSAHAQPATPQADRDHQAQIDFSIPAGSLGAAIGQFGLQAGIPIRSAPALLQGRQTQGLQGRFAVTDALARLLAGTGLRAQPSAQGGYVLQSIPAAGNAQTLEVVTVSGMADNTTEGTGNYVMAGPSTSATGLRLTQLETPQSITVIAQQRIEDQSLNDVGDILKQVTGVTVQNSMSDQQNYYVRGFEVENFQFDGMPARFDSGWDGGMSKADSAIYDRVEVIRGATGLLNGGGNPSATINLVRKKPTRDPQAAVEVQTGSWDLRRIQADLSGALIDSGRLRGRLVTAHQKRNSYMDYRNTEKQLAYGILEFDLTPDTLLTLGADWQKNNNNGASYGGIPLFYNDGSQTTDLRRSFNPGTRWGYWDQTSYNLFGTLEQRFNDDWSARLALSRQSLHDDAFATATASGNPDPVTGAGVSQWICRCDSRRTSDAVDLQVSGAFSALGRSHDLILGANFMDAERRSPNHDMIGYDTSIDNFFEWDGNTIKPDYVQTGFNNRTIRQSGAYVATRLRPLDGLSLILGTRLSNWKETQNSDFGSGLRTQKLSQHNIFTPYAGLVYEYTSGHSVYASYTEIFRPQIGMRDRDDNLLDPVSGVNLELGAKSEFMDGALMASAALFQIQQDNLGVLDEDYTQPLPDGSSAYRMAKGIKTRGFELELTGYLTPDWQIQAGYTHQSSRDANHDKVNTNRPDRMLKLWTNWRLPGDWRRLTVGAGINWQSRLTYTASGWGVPAAITGKTAVQSSYALVGLMANYTVNDNLSFTLNVNNLLDKKYYQGFGAYASGMYGEPRNFALAARYRF